MLFTQGDSYLAELYTGRLHTEVVTLAFLYTAFDKKGNPFMYLPSKMASLSSI